MKYSKKSPKTLLSLILAVNLLFNFCAYNSLAVSSIGSGLLKDPSILKTPSFGKVFTNSGKTTLYGSTLNLSENELNILVPKTVIEGIKKFGIPPVTLYSDSGLTNPYRIEISKSNIKTKVLNKRRREVIVFNLSDALTRIAFNPGETARPKVNLAELPSDEYRIRLLEAGAFDITTEPFTYEPPALIVGKVDPTLIMGSVLVSVENLEGNKISDGIVAVNPDGNFITEVRANKITEEPAIIHAIAEKDFYALLILNNAPESNAEIAKNPILINEATTLEASLAKKNKNVANDIAKEKENKEGTKPKEGEIKDISETDCNIKQFATECDLNSIEILTSIGTKFKNFLQTQICNFTEYELIKKVILATKEETNLDIGKGYCEFFGRQKDENKPCDVYEEILKEFKQGHIKGLPCPPDFCTNFKDIKPPKCFFVNDFCEDSVELTRSLQRICRGSNCFEPPPCIKKPEKDLFCKKVGDEITEKECVNNITSLKGIKYCIPNLDGKTQEELIKECELRECHKKCEEPVGPTPVPSPTPNPTPIEPPFVYPPGAIIPHGRLQTESGSDEIAKCHLKCDVEFGNKADCSNAESEFFSIKCCAPTTQETIIIISSDDDFGNITLGTAIQNKSSGLKGCLCKSRENFDEKGLVKKEAQEACKQEESIKKDCLEGKEKDPKTGQCIEKNIESGGNICPAGTGPSKTIPCKCKEPATPTGTGNECICEKGKVYAGDKGCIDETASEIPICEPTQFKSVIIPCKCAPGADFNEEGLCKCSNEKAYSIKGCGDTITPTPSPTPKPSPTPSTTPTPKPTPTPSPTPKPTPTPVASICTVNEKPATAGCVCASGATVNASGVCQCTQAGESYTSFGCTSTFCSATQVSTKEDPCVCKGTATPTGLNGECKCSNGREYSPTLGGCGD